MAKILVVQLQTELLTSDLLEIALQELEAISSDARLVLQAKSEQAEDNRYINAEFESTDVADLWHEIEKKLFLQNPRGSELKKGTIVVCYGDSGWDHYLLLHHFDPSAELDDLF